MLASPVHVQVRDHSVVLSGHNGLVIFTPRESVGLSHDISSTAVEEGPAFPNTAHCTSQGVCSQSYKLSGFSTENVKCALHVIII